MDNMACVQCLFVVPEYGFELFDVLNTSKPLVT